MILAEIVPTDFKKEKTYGADRGVNTFRYKSVFQARLTAFIATSVTIANRGPRKIYACTTARK